jgi:hypothetical protein
MSLRFVTDSNNHPVRLIHITVMDNTLNIPVYRHVLWPMIEAIPVIAKLLRLRLFVDPLACALITSECSDLLCYQWKSLC